MGAEVSGLSFNERFRRRVRAEFGRCQDCGHEHGTDAPRWESDPVAQMLNVAHLGCPCCGHGAIEERDDEAPSAALTTDPSEGDDRE